MNENVEEVVVENDETNTNNVSNEIIAESADNGENAVNQAEKLRYQANSFSYMFGLLAVVLDAIFIFVAFNQMNVYTYDVANDVKMQWLVFPKILINIFLVLASFLGSEKVKTYSEKWSIIMIVFGGVAILRMFFVPLLLITGNPILIGQTDAASKRAVMGVILIVILGLMAASYILCGVVGYKKSKKLHKYLESIDTSLN